MEWRNGFELQPLKIFFFIFCWIFGTFKKLSNMPKIWQKNEEKHFQRTCKLMFWLIPGYTRKSDFGYPIRHYCILATTINFFYLKNTVCNTFHRGFLVFIYILHSQSTLELDTFLAVVVKEPKKNSMPLFKWFRGSLI